MDREALDLGNTSSLHQTVLQMTKVNETQQIIKTKILDCVDGLDFGSGYHGCI